MVTAWLLLLGFLLAGYFVLGGYDYGVQMLGPLLGRDGAGCRPALGAVGPFLFGNEVWLVAAVGVLFGAFPVLEGKLLAGFYPLVLALLLGLVIGTTTMQLRSRWSGARILRTAEIAMMVGGAVPAAVWGMFVTILLRGVPAGPDDSFGIGLAQVSDPFVLAGGVTGIVLFAAHGAAFLALRAPDRLAARAARTGLVLARVAAGGVAVTLLIGVLTGLSVANPDPALLLGAVVVAALLAGSVLLGRQRFGVAFAATALAAATPVLLLGAAHAPDMIVATDSRFSMSIAESAAAPETLALLGIFGVFLVPTILAYQAWSWWAFRGRVDPALPGWF